jgi:hypothetical protein
MKLCLVLHGPPPIRAGFTQQGCHRVVVLFDFDGDPRPAKNNIRAQNLVLERGPEGSRLTLSNRFLHLSSQATDGADAGTLKPAHLELAIEHTCDECSILEYLGRRSYQFQLLHNLGRGIEFQDNTRGRNTKAWNVASEALDG